MADHLLLEDGVSSLLQEDNSSVLVLEDAAPTITAPFIASVSQLYIPTLQNTGFALSFIGSVTALYPIQTIWSIGTKVCYDATTTWVCPPGVTRIYIEATGAGGGGDVWEANRPLGAGGGGAYAAGGVPVTPGTTYTVTVGTGATNANGGDSSFVGDSSTTISAQGGRKGTNPSGGAGGAAASSSGTQTQSGGRGGNGLATASFTGGPGGGEAGGPEGDGNAGVDAVAGDPAKAGGSGGTSGGDGGSGGVGNSQTAGDGVAPGGGGGGLGSNAIGGTGGAGASGRVCLTYISLDLGFIPSSTQLYTPALVHVEVAAPFVASVTAVYTPTLVPGIAVPFISSHTTVHALILYTPATGPGNGGETFAITLNANGTTTTATLAGDITATATALTLTGDTGMPATGFCVTIDDEVLMLVRTSTGNYRIVRRALSNTAATAHTAGADADWTDTYDMAVVATNEIGSTVDYTVDGNTYDAWLIAFDSSQAYIGASRYSTFVDELVGVFPPGTGSTGTNRLDGAQATAAHAPATTTDDCPVGITTPARLSSDIEVGDVALLRYTNTEAVELTLGPRSSAIQSWYGFMRVDSSNTDVTASDPTGTVVDGAIDEEFFDSYFDTVTLPGSSRTFTHGGSPPNYDDKGWPIAALAVRQDVNRIPHWTSPDWHDFAFVYSGFGTDCTFVQVLINRNGFDPLHPELGVALPGSQDIDGPNATWDDKNYYSSVAWYVGIFKSSVLLTGPPLNPPGPPPTGIPPQPPSPLPDVPPGPGGGGTVNPPDTGGLEGGEGGGFPPPTAARTAQQFWVTLV